MVRTLNLESIPCWTEHACLGQVRQVNSHLYNFAAQQPQQETLVASPREEIT